MTACTLLLDLKACKMLLFVSKWLCLCVLCLCPMFACVCVCVSACISMSVKDRFGHLHSGGVTCQCLVPHVTYVAAVMWCQSISMLERYTPCASIPWSKTMYLVSRQKKICAWTKQIVTCLWLASLGSSTPHALRCKFCHTHTHLLPSV